MCSIIGLVNIENSKEKIITGLEILKRRGKDNNGVFFNGKIVYFKSVKECCKENITGEVVFGHNLHAVVGNLPQPIKNKESVLVSNCEVYNWRRLAEKYNINAENDSEFILKAIDKKGFKVIEEFSGPFAFCYYKNNQIYLRRDLLGIKPLWYYFDDKSFAFASEKKVLEKIGLENINYLDPRKELFYDVLKKKIKVKSVPFYEIKKGKTSVQEIFQKLEASVLKRIPDKTKKIGLLYSGGIDSLILAKILKDNQIPFTGYFAYSDNVNDPKDLLNVLKSEKEYNFKIEKIKVKKEDTKKAIKYLVDLIESSNPIKIGVSLPIYFASKKAREDGCKVIFSGLGSDEIFAGYHRFKESKHILKDTINLLYQMHENDLYRDDVICMNNNIELRVPYLDKDLIEESFKLKDEQKIKNGENKIILRKIGKKINLLKEDYNRKKIAAQYGSGFDKMIEKIAKEKKIKTKSEYLKKLAKKENLNLGCLYSGGKDSNLALYIMKKQNYKISCIMTMITENPDSYMFQKVDDKILSLQSTALRIPFVLQKTKGIKEEELKDLKKLIAKAKEKYSLQGIITGAIQSNYQRERIQEICNELGLRLFSPLWNKTQEGVLKETLENDFEMIFVKIAGAGLSEKWLGKRFTKEDLIDLKIISKTKGLNIAGEGGEYETIILNGPTFNQKIKITSANPIMENEFTGYLDILKINLEDK
jgi:diphthine-ammonia ligase